MRKGVLAYLLMLPIELEQRGDNVQPYKFEVPDAIVQGIDRINRFNQQLSDRMVGLLRLPHETEVREQLAERN